MKAYLPLENPTSNRIKALWYQPWQAGYADILKRGFPRPDNPRAILAELHSPRVPDFIHHGAGDVPFLVSGRAREIFERAQLTGLAYEPAIVAKIATKGLRPGKSRGGEPEDVILKARGISLAEAPQLFAVYVTGRVGVVPDFKTGKTPAGLVSPFRPQVTLQAPDLWRPVFDGHPFSAWTFCSEKFRAACTEHRLTNIAFQPFSDFMENFRRGVS